MAKIPCQNSTIFSRSGALVVVFRYSHDSTPAKPSSMLDSSGWYLRMRYSDMLTGLLVSNSRSTVAS